MNAAIAVSNSLQHGREQSIAPPAAEQGMALDRSLLLIPVLAAAAWLMTIAVLWLAWCLLP